MMKTLILQLGSLSPRHLKLENKQTTQNKLLMLTQKTPLLFTHCTRVS